MHGSGSESYPKYENGKTFPAKHLFSEANLLQAHQKIATSLRKRLVLTFIPSKGNGKVSQKLKPSQAKRWVLAAFPSESNGKVMISRTKRLVLTAIPSNQRPGIRK